MNIETANRLVQLRKDNGMSQETLAGKLGISRQAISKWERAEASPDTDNLIALAELYGMSLDSLLNTMNDEYVIGELKKEDQPQEKPPKSKRQLLASKLLKFPTPIFIVAIYLALGFFVDWWHPSWLVILLIPIYYHLAGGLCCRSDKAMLLAMPIPEVVVLIYLIFGFTFNWWHPAWIIFFIIPLYYWLISVFYHSKKKD